MPATSIRIAKKRDALHRTALLPDGASRMTGTRARGDGYITRAAEGIDRCDPRRTGYNWDAERAILFRAPSARPQTPPWPAGDGWPRLGPLERALCAPEDDATSHGYAAARRGARGARPEPPRTAARPRRASDAAKSRRFDVGRADLSGARPQTPTSHATTTMGTIFSRRGSDLTEREATMPTPEYGRRRPRRRGT